MTEPQLERLRGWFETLQDIDGDGERCPEAGRIRDSAAERLATAENESVLLHVAACGACAASWRLARELLSESESARPAIRSTVRPWWIGLAAAVVAGMAIGVFVLHRPGRPGVPAPVFREGERLELISGIDPNARLPREDLVLRWTGAPAGTTYDVRVTGERLEPLHRAFGLEIAEHRVPAEALDGLAPGAVILWSVGARLPDGRRLPPVTFRATVD